MPKFLLIALSLTLSSHVSFSQSDSYNAKVKEFLEVNGSKEAFKTAVNMMISQFKSTNSNISEEFWSDFEKEIKATSIDDLVLLIAPVYNKYLTEKELDDIIDFYKSPTGKKFGGLTSQITQETMIVGQQWGMQLGQKIAERIKEKGY